MTKHALLNEATMTNIKSNGRTNIYEGPNGTLNSTNTRTLFAAKFDRIHRIVNLLGPDQRGRSSITRPASRIPAITERRRVEKARPGARTDRASGIFGLNLALTVPPAEEATV